MGNDWDALEFSPVYQCLERRELYSQLRSECVTSCSPAAEMTRGQCVRKGLGTEEHSFRARWHLEINCGPSCFANKRTAASHMVRLAVADHLDVPFQEVTRVHLFRRERAANLDAVLVVSVQTHRLSEDEGHPLLRSFISDASELSSLLGFEITSVQLSNDVNWWPR